MNLLKQPNQRVLLYGLSYGSYLVHRFLQIYPNFVELVVFDGIASPKKTQFLIYDKEANGVGLEFLDMCEKYPICKRMIPSPREAIKRVFDIIERQNYCQNVTKRLTKGILRNIFFILIRARDEETRILILPIIHRFLRCNSNDQTELNHFFNVMKIPKFIPYKDYTELVYSNIGVSEMLYNSTNLPSIRELEIEQNQLFFSADISLKTRYLKEIWPSYKLDQYYNLFAKTNVPFLMIQGDLDPQTVHHQATFLFGKLKRNHNQYLVKFRNLQHRAIARGDCPYNIAINFMKNPRLPPLISCVNDYEIDIDGSKDAARIISQKYFNTKFLWK